MIFISIILVFSVISIKKSLHAIQSNTESMEIYTRELANRTKRIDDLIVGMKDLLQKL